MYLAKYTLDDTSWCQAAGELVYPTAPPIAETDPSWDAFGARVQALDSIPRLSTSLRVHLRDRLTSALFVSAPSEYEVELRRSLATFAQLGGPGDGEVRFSSARGDHDDLLAFPATQCRVSLPRMAAGGAWFTFDFRARTHLSQLFIDARTQQQALSYHVNIERVHVTPEWRREAAHNALRVADVRGVPQPLANLQRELSDKLLRATHICEEILGVEDATAADWLRSALTRRFVEIYGRHGEPDFRISEDSSNELSLVATRHRMLVEPLAADEVCAAALNRDERVHILSWLPDRTLRDLEPAAATGGADDATLQLDYGDMPPPYEGHEPFAFVSYKREDLPRIKPLVAALHRAGHRIWYDRGIPGGAEWDALIEERVKHCEVLVMFLSQAAVGSKYVRREVKFADTLGKPVVGVRLEHDIDLAHGLAMLLNQYQVIDGVGDTIVAELERVVRFVRLL